MIILKYVNDINDIKYNIDIIDELLELVIKDKCCIHHNILVKYRILSLNKGTSVIKRIIEQYEFNEHNYRLSNVAESIFGRCTHKTEYYFHPEKMRSIFSLCSVRASANRAKRETFRRKVFLMHLNYV